MEADQAEKDHGRRPFFGCSSISRKIFARASSSESLEEGRQNTRLTWKQDHDLGLKKRLSKLNPAAAIANKIKGRNHDNPKQGLGTITGVLIPVCENMWGVLIFLRFYYIVGNAGVWQTFIVVCISFACAISTTMSLSAIATNGPIEEGGTYYLISRALGPKLGGTVGVMYYLGVSLLAVLESLGAVEMLLFTFPALEFPSANRVIGASIIVLLGFLVYFGISFVSKLSLGFFFVVIYAMCSYYLGLFTAPRGNAPANLTGLKWSTFTDNWNSGYDSGVSFPVALAIFFPCFTGILSGADRAKNLARPEKSIPAGTIGAVMISVVMYMSYMGLWAAVGTRDYLLGRAPDGTKRGHGQNLEVVNDVAFPLAILTQLGIIVASMAQALQCLITSPRLLQAIANDGVIPFLRRLSKTSKTGEPRRALVVTTALCIVAAMIGSLDAVAPLVSICFLTAYSALNLSCFVFSIVQAPSWRPKWKFYHWTAALAGFLLCFAISFVIKWYMAIVAVVVQAFIYIYIDYRQVEVDWGSGLGGLRLQLAVQSIHAVGHEARYTVNWRPQLLCLCKPRSARVADDHNNEEFMLFVSQLKKGRGLCVVATILEGTIEKMAPQVKAERLELENTMQAANVTGFARVLVAPSYREGKSYAIQSSGLGALEPNTLVLGWPNKWYEEGHYHSAQVMLEILDECKAVNKAVVLCMNLDEFPMEGTQQDGYIDVWWMVHDGGLLLILAHLLKQHRIWRKCKLRVCAISDQMHDTSLVKKNLLQTLNRVRIEAEVQVFDISSGGLAPYTYDTTIRLEEARAFAKELAEYRLGQEQQKKPLSEDLDVSEKTSPHEPSKSGDRQTLDNIFKDRSSDHQSHQTPQLVIVDKNDKVERILRKTVPTELSMLEGTPYQPRPRSGSIQPLKIESGVDDSLVRVATEKESEVPQPTIAESNQRRGGKETRWANECEDAVAEDAELEIIVEETKEDEDENAEQEDHPPMVRTGSAGQLYPGSPHHSDYGANIALPEVVQRTWETFSQNYSPTELNDIILEHSKDAQLVLLNLPDHYQGMEPARYMEYCEKVTQGLTRVLLIHGTGKELWGGQEIHI
ncbi:unnamed protein product [Calypogeia fissa]